MVTDLANKEDKVALVVEADVIHQRLLHKLLGQLGYEVFIAENGRRGIELYSECMPDIVLMDIDMPVMDGYQAAREIKKLASGRFLPLIFFVKQDSEDIYINCFDAGGDGVVVWPFSPQYFHSKVKSVERIGILYNQLQTLQQSQQQDAELAEQLMAGVIEARNYGTDKINIVAQAAELFSGDIHLTALCPNGDVNVLLGDFTGHGLRSSIGAIPLAETFRAMTKKGFSLDKIIAEVNRQLYQLLPTDLFLAAAVATVSSHDQSVYIFNAGLPDVYLLSESGRIKRKVNSVHPPLGIMENLLSDTAISVHTVKQTDTLVMFSDGVIEARAPSDKMFGIKRLEKCMKAGVVSQQAASTIIEEVNAFCHGLPQEDDISIIEVPCGGWGATSVEVSKQAINLNNTNYCLLEHDNVDPAWQWQMKLTGTRLANVNPIPMVMNQIQEIEGERDRWQSIYTILTELYVNALDHGVLGLSSELKSSPEGFAEYFKERQLRLNQLASGYIDIELKYYALNQGAKLVIRIKDSGEGFDIKRFFAKACEDNGTSIKLSGRGIELVLQLSDTLHYYEEGSLVEVSVLC